MEDERVIRWEAREPGAGVKSREWYFSVGIVALGVAVASVIATNVLLALIALIGGFAIMLAGSRPPSRMQCTLSERGLSLGHERIPFTNIKRFGIADREGKNYLVVDVMGLIGITSVPLGDADFRAVRMEFKNHNIEEDEELDSMAERLARAIGI